MYWFVVSVSVFGFYVDMVFFIALFVVLIFFFKQKTAYEMRISDWSSDVCSSDLSPRTRTANGSQSRDSGFLYTSGPDAVVFGGRGTRDCATTDTKIGRASCREGVCQYV